MLTSYWIKCSMPLDAMRESAGIRYNRRSYDKLNVARFYTKLQDPA